MLKTRYAVIFIFNYNFTELHLHLISNCIYESIACFQIHVFSAKRN